MFGPPARTTSVPPPGRRSARKKMYSAPNLEGAMPESLLELLAERRGESFALHERYLNTQHVKVLKTIGFDRRYVRGEGPYLWDDAGNRYLDLLSGFGVFALGRNHPTSSRRCARCSRASCRAWCRWTCRCSPGSWPSGCRHLPGRARQGVLRNSGAEAVEAAIKFARYATGRPGSSTASTPSTGSPWARCR